MEHSAYCSKIERGKIWDIGDFRFQSLRRAMLHWIKKGDADRAYQRARDCVHIYHAVLRENPRDVVVKAWTDPNRDPLTDR